LGRYSSGFSEVALPPWNTFGTQMRDWIRERHDEGWRKGDPLENPQVFLAQEERPSER
jgi:hypothetical protein